MQNEQGLARFAPLSGLLFIVVLIGGFIVMGDEPPDADEPLAKIAEFWRDLGDEAYVGIGMEALAALLLVFFGGSLYKALRPAEGETARLSLIAFGGLAIVAVGLLVDASITLTLLEEADDLDPVAIQTLNALFNNDYVPMAGGIAILALSAGLLIVRTGVLPKWLGWIALLLFVIGFTPIGFASAIGMALWVGVVSVILFLRGNKNAAAPAAA